jgi:hypothetical protein
MCGEGADAETAVPCTFCAGWFHLTRNSTTAGQNCGRRSLNFLQDGTCGTLYICRDCDQRLANGTAPSAPNAAVWTG